MLDMREEILNKEHDRLVESCGRPRNDGQLVVVYRSAALFAMDEYMKEVCLELLEYMAKNSVECVDSIKGYQFYYRGQYLSKEELFENFL